MKKNILITTILLCSLASCTGKNEPAPSPVIDNDSTDTYLSTKERGLYRTFFKPQIAWVGDVMPFYDESSETFHIFYLQDWRPAAGIIHPVWDVETKDFSTYRNNREAIPLGKNYEQDVTIGTGGAIRAQDGKYHFFYTGEMADNKDCMQAIMHATSDNLVSWTKDKLFGYMRATEGYSPNDFRDACTFYDPDARIYRMAVSTLFRGSNAIAHYTSSDLQTWTPAPEPLIKDAPHFMECSDFFKMGNRWYMTYSSINAPRCVYYRYKEGDLNNPYGWSDPQPLDGRCYYAAKTAADKQGRRYLCGWLQTRAGTHDSSDWGGALVVHQIGLDGVGPNLICSVPEGVYNKYSKAVQPIEQKKEYTTLEQGVYRMDAAAGRAFVQFNRLRSPMRITCQLKRVSNTGIFGFTFAASSDEHKAHHLRFILEPDNNNKSDLAHDSEEKGQMNLFNIHRIRDDREYQITLCIEKSVAVMYINGKVAFSCRIYDMENNPWQIFCESGQIEISDLQMTTY